jgi:hypothetical protein
MREIEFQETETLFGKVPGQKIMRTPIFKPLKTMSKNYQRRVFKNIITGNINKHWPPFGAGKGEIIFPDHGG